MYRQMTPTTNIDDVHVAVMPAVLQLNHMMSVELRDFTAAETRPESSARLATSLMESITSLWKIRREPILNLDKRPLLQHQQPEPLIASGFRYVPLPCP